MRCVLFALLLLMPGASRASDVFPEAMDDAPTVRNMDFLYDLVRTNSDSVASISAASSVGVSTMAYWDSNTMSGSGACPAGSSVTATVGAYPLEFIFHANCDAYGVNTSYATIGLNVFQDGGFIDGFTAGKYMARTYNYGDTAGANTTAVGTRVFVPCGRTYRTKSAVVAGSHTWCLGVTIVEAGVGDANLKCDTGPCSLEVREYRGVLAP